MACTAMITGIKLVASSKKDIGVDRGEQGQSALERHRPSGVAKRKSRDLVGVGPGTGWRRPLPLRDRMAPPHGRRDALDGLQDDGWSDGITRAAIRGNTTRMARPDPPRKPLDSPSAADLSDAYLHIETRQRTPSCFKF